MRIYFEWFVIAATLFVIPFVFLVGWGIATTTDYFKQAIIFCTIALCLLLVGLAGLLLEMATEG